MPNFKYANEWLSFAWKNLETAKLLIREKHFTDSIAIEIHQVIEKSFKAILAFYGIKIPKTHSLGFLYGHLEHKIKISEDSLDAIFVISDYYESEKYPGPKYFIPNRDEVEKHFSIAENIYKLVQNHIESNKSNKI